MTGRIISLYTGVLGLDRPFHWHGFTTAAACDSSAYCRHVIGHYLPDIPIYGSDEDVTFDRLRRDGINPATIAGVVGGPPCQPSSHAGKRFGVADPRWRWPEALRVVGDIRPHWFVFEQPVGIVSLVMPDGERPFLAIIAALAALGYRVGYDRWPAIAVGAPHPRMRVALIGVREDVADAHGRGCGTPIPDDATGQRNAERRGLHAVGHAGRELVNGSRQYGANDVAQTAGEEGRGGQRRLLRPAARPGRRRSRGAVGVGQADTDGARSPQYSQRSGESIRQRPAIVGNSRSLAGVADAPRGGLSPRRPAPAWQQGRSDADERGPSGIALAHPSCVIAPPGHGTANNGQRGDATDGRGGAFVADTQSALGRMFDGLSCGLAHLWPAGRGHHQFAWEPPRLVTRPPRGSAASLVAEAELEALGNSIVSQQFEPVAAAMADIERQLELAEVRV